MTMDTDEWQPISKTDMTGDKMLLWHRLWDCGPQVGYWDETTSWWRLGDEKHWLRVGIFPSHRWKLPPHPPLDTSTPPASVESADAGEGDATRSARLLRVGAGYADDVARNTKSLELRDAARRAATIMRDHARALTLPSTSSAAGGTDDGWQAERERLRKLMWDHTLTLPISQRAAWIEPMGVVRRGRFLTNQEKLQNLADGLDMPLDQVASALARDLSVLDRAPDLPVSPAPSAMPSPAVSEVPTNPVAAAAHRAGEQLAWQKPIYDRRRTAEPEAVSYAKELAISLHRKFYPEVTQWHVLEDLYGVLTQIDNMTTGLVRAPEPVRHDDAKGEAVASDAFERLHIESLTREWFAGPKPNVDGYLAVLKSRFNRLAAANPILPAPEPSAGMEPAMPMARALYQHVSDLGIHGPEPKIWERQTAEHRRMWLLALSAALRADTRQNTGGTK